MNVILLDFMVNQRPRGDLNLGTNSEIWTENSKSLGCAGDFNELTRAGEKLGGNRRSHNQMQLFWDALHKCGFINLGYLEFTWRKHFANGQSI